MFKFILDLLPFNYIRLAAIVGAFLAGCFLSYKVTSSFYTEEVITLESSLKQYQIAYSTLSKFSQKQSIRIVEMKQLQDEKSREIEIAQKAARIASKRFYDEANTLSRKTLEEGSTACAEASKLIDEELRKER